MIGVLGGTFDPIHFGHLRPACDLLRRLPLDEIRFLPCRVPPHRAMPAAASHHRWHMLNLALAGENRLVADDRELLREGPSYSVDTLHDLRRELGPDESLCLIMGADAFNSLSLWHRWEEIPALANILIMTRPDSKLERSGAAFELLSQSQGDPSRVSAGCVVQSEVKEVDVSATHVRELIAGGGDARGLLPDAVLRYIKCQGLYGEH